MAIWLSIFFAVPLGIISAIRPDGWLDYGARVFTLAGISISNFLFGILLILFLVRLFNWLPPLDYVEIWDEPLKNLQQMAFPAIALAFYDMAFIARVSRSSMLEILREDYMRTARAKGLSERVVLMRHGLKNASLPILTMTGWQFGRLLEGTVIIEIIFLIPGMGRILIEAVFQQDACPYDSGCGGDHRDRHPEAKPFGRPSLRDVGPQDSVILAHRGLRNLG